MMNDLKFYRFFLFAIFFTGLSMSGADCFEAPPNGAGKTESESIVINSNTVEMNNEEKVVTFSGNVNAKKNGFVIDCDKMLVYYRNSPATLETGERETRIEKIIAMGNVRINRAKGGIATGEKATYYQEEEKIVLTGSPTVKQGNDVVTGNLITIFLQEDRSVVQGSEDKKVSVTIAPRREKR